VALSKQARAEHWLEEALEQFPIKVLCPNCRKTIGRYRPGRVERASRVLPTVNFKCTRVGCRTEAVVVLSETIE